MSIFHSPAFAALHGIPRYELDHCCILVDRERCSPGVGTFGGFSSVLPIEDMDRLLFSAHPHEVKLAPASHDPELFAASVNVLSRAGFAIWSADLNYDLRIDKRDLPARMQSGNRKKYAKAVRDPYVESRMLRPEDWALAWSLVAENRRRSGHVLSMTLKQIVDQADALPDTTFVFGTTYRSQLVAAAICFALSPRVFYVYAWGDSARSELAPTVHLAAFIYDYARTHSYKILDAGISTLAGEPNAGLIAFKQSLGFRPSLKLTMRK